jgi:hypothetical protein
MTTSLIRMNVDPQAAAITSSARKGTSFVRDLAAIGTSTDLA